MSKRKSKPTHIYRVEMTNEGRPLSNSTNMSYQEDWFEGQLSYDMSGSKSKITRRFYRGTITWELVEERVEGGK